LPQNRHNSSLPTLKVPKPFQGFINFIREQGVVGIGVGFVVGTSAAVLIKSVVTNLVNPLIGVVMGGADLSSKVICLSTKSGICRNSLNYGQVISDILSFILILAVVYFVIKSLRLEKLDKEKPEKK
jgi:large conductance mechanosensitive channel